MTLSVVEGFPRHFGRFVLLTSFGRGGMGEVFLGKQRVGDVARLCVIKTLRGDLADAREYIARFNDEARVIVQLNHGNISQVYEAGAVGTDHFLAMEFIHGVNLKDLLADLAERRTPLSPGLSCVAIGAVLDALAYAHRLRSPTTGQPLNVVHRDVSLANVMVSFEGDVKLIDFGLAESTLKTEHTETRVVMGKVAYMSPEQARGEEVTAACDQFAAAVMLYEAITSDRFYGEMNTHQIWQVVGVGGFVPRRWLDVPEALRSVLATALDKRPEHRFATTDAFRDALDDVRSQLWPRAKKADLRALLQEVYAERISREQALVASFSHLEPPAMSVGTVESMPRSAPVAIAGTEPFLTSPSRPFGDPAGPGVPRGQPVEPTVSAARDVVEPTAVMAPRRAPAAVVVEPSVSRVVVPANSAARGVAAAVAVALGAVVVVGLVGRSGGDTPRAPGTTVVAIHDAGSLDLIERDAGSPTAAHDTDSAGALTTATPTATPTPTTAAPTTAAPTTAAPTPAAPTTASTSPKPTATARPQPPTPGPAPPAPAPPAPTPAPTAPTPAPTAPTPAPAPPTSASPPTPAPAALSPDEELALVRRCPDAPDLVRNGKLTATTAPAIHLWAMKCRQLGVR